jgi:hypothetical protein
LLLAALLVVVGMQFFALGLLGELIIFTHARDMKDYRVEEVIQYPEALASSSTDGVSTSNSNVNMEADIRTVHSPAVVA